MGMVSTIACIADPLEMICDTSRRFLRSGNQEIEIFQKS